MIKEEIFKLDKITEEKILSINEILMSLPNLPHEDVPIGKDESSNKLVKKVGEIPSYSFKPKPHYELGEDLKMLDFEQASKVSGTRFVYLKQILITG